MGKPPIKCVFEMWNYTATDIEAPVLEICGVWSIPYPQVHSIPEWDYF